MLLILFTKKEKRTLQFVGPEIELLFMNHFSSFVKLNLGSPIKTK